MICTWSRERAEAATISMSESSLIPTGEEDKDRKEVGVTLQEGRTRMGGYKYECNKGRKSICCLTVEPLLQDDQYHPCVKEIICVLPE